MNIELFFKVPKIVIATLMMLLIIPVLNLKICVAQAAKPTDVSLSSADDPVPAFIGHGQPKGNLGVPHSASRHILVQLHPRADKRQFLQNAKARGLNRLSHVFGSRWMTMSIPAGAGPRQAAAAA